MKYRIVKFPLISGGEGYQPQYKYKYWPFWFDISGATTNELDAKQRVEQHKKPTKIIDCT